MSKKIVGYKEQSQYRQTPSQPLPTFLKLKNITNQPHNNELLALKLRIDQLQNKVNVLETKIKLKRKRIRRKSCDVEKRHRCQMCKKKYGSLVSLNLHIRIKHKKDSNQLQMKQQDHKMPCKMENSSN